MQRVLNFLRELKIHAQDLGRDRLILRYSILFIVVFVLWAGIFEVDQVSRVNGQVVALMHTQSVQSADGGVISEVNVAEGDEVKQGQVLARLESARANLGYEDSQNKVANLQASIIRLRAELELKEPVMPAELEAQFPGLMQNQRRLHGLRYKLYNDEIKALETSLKLLEEEYSMNQSLYKFGDISKADLMRVQRQLIEYRGQVSTRKNRYFQDIQLELSRAEEDLSQQRYILSERKNLLDHSEIVAPTTGVVKSIKVHTIGAIVRPGEEVMQILPTESALVVEAKMRPTEVGNIKVGLPALVKLDAFDYSVFGSLRGRVTFISPDAITEEGRMGEQIYYKILVSVDEPELKREKGKELKLQPGLTASLEIKTGERSILKYLLKPISRGFSGALSER